MATWNTSPINRSNSCSLACASFAGAEFVLRPLVLSERKMHDQTPKTLKPTVHRVRTTISQSSVEYNALLSSFSLRESITLSSSSKPARFAAIKLTQVHLVWTGLNCVLRVVYYTSKINYYFTRRQTTRKSILRTIPISKFTEMCCTILHALCKKKKKLNFALPHDGSVPPETRDIQACFQIPDFNS
jgi:hypothetical protein